ncbi:SHOCT domain-containing protein [Natrarchaeobius sp. A-rgal3]|uniref:SHOCT domain-containing protein n=1 Tax=Natrarchaeobius versutus TaxID=1679078 RepID=UPI0035102595
MYDLVHRYAPDSPAGRTAVAIVTSLFGVPAFVFGVLAFLGAPLVGLVFLALSVPALAIAGCLTLGVVRQANEAPTATPLTEPRADEDGSARTDAETEPPIETLRRRYAAGKLDDEEFQRRLDRLLETETAGKEHSQTDLEPALE